MDNCLWPGRTYSSLHLRVADSLRPTITSPERRMLDNELLGQLVGRSVVVTGGTGMIGRQVVRIAAEAGAAVRVVSLDRIHVHPQAEHVYGDLTDFNFCKQVTSGVDYVCHVAGIKGSIEVTKSK